MPLSIGRRLSCALIALCVVLAGALTSCGKIKFGDPALTVTHVNETDQPLQFYWQYEGGNLWPEKDPVQPHSSVEAPSRMITRPSFRLVAERSDGVKVFDRTFTWDELERQQGRVIVSSLDPIQ